MSVQHIALVLEASGLKPQEKAVLTAFCNHTDPSGKTFAGEQRLMREAGMSRSTFQEWRARLVERELLISKRKGRKGGGRTTSDTWVNLAALRAARDPFFAREDTDRPEDENPFSQVKGNGPETRAEGGAMARRPGPKGGGNGPEARAINGPETRATQARRPGPDPSVIPQGESFSGDPSVSADTSTPVEVVSDEREAAAPEDDKPVGVPSPSSAAGRGSGEIAGRNSDQALLVDQPSGDVDQVLAAYEEAAGGPALPGVRARLVAEAGELLAVRPLWWVIERARELPQYGTSLARHAEMSKVPFARPVRKPVAGACLRHPAFQEDDCAPCRKAEQQRRQRPASEPGPVGGLALLAKHRAS